jgi:hypothetical protein
LLNGEDKEFLYSYHSQYTTDGNEA